VKWLLVALVALVGSVAVALVALPDPGYVLIGYGKYSVETTLLAFVVLLLLAYLGLRLLGGLWRVPVRVQRWDRRRHSRRLQLAFDDATRALAEGQFQRAERRLARVLRSRQAPLQAYFSAALAASRQGDRQRRARYMRLALERQPGAETGILFQQAELELAEGELEQAQTTLTRLRTLAPHNVRTLRLLLQLYMQQQDWQQLRELLPDLRRSEVLDSERWQQLAVQVYREQVQGFASATEVDALNAGWQQLPPPVQQDQGLQALYVEQLVRLGGHAQAGRLLRRQLNESWNERLVYLYGDLQEEDAAGQQKQAERWLQKHPHDAVLLLVLAKISLRNQLWGKARSYLEASISQQPSAQAYRLLATLLEQLDEPDQAAECYRRGLTLGETTPTPMSLSSATPGDDTRLSINRSA